MAKFIILILIFASFTSWLCFLHYFAPVLSDERVKGELKFPNSLKELQEIAVILRAYSVNHWWYVLLLFGSAYIYKQSFCIPGSIFLISAARLGHTAPVIATLTFVTFLIYPRSATFTNHSHFSSPGVRCLPLQIAVAEHSANLLSGALYGQLGGIFFACLFTAIGASICYCISKTFAKDLVYYYFPKRITSFQEKISANKDNLLYFMLFVRLVPITPGWVINVVAPLVDVPFFIFFITTFFGLGPYNFVGVSAGGMLASIQSINDIFTWGVLLKISAMGLAAVCPAYIFRKVSSSR